MEGLVGDSASASPGLVAVGRAAVAAEGQGSARVRSGHRWSLEGELRSPQVTTGNVGHLRSLKIASIRQRLLQVSDMCRIDCRIA